METPFASMESRKEIQKLGASITSNFITEYDD
jgi:hypothetical protein